MIQLIKPSVIYNNKVLLEWSVIEQKPGSFIKAVLKRSKNSDMSGAVDIFESENLNDSYEDTSISEGIYYYLVEAQFVNNPYEGDKLDFSSGEGFYLSDPVAIVFEDGAVTLKKLDSEININIDLSEAVLTEDTEYVGGEICIKGVD